MEFILGVAAIAFLWWLGVRVWYAHAASQVRKAMAATTTVQQTEAAIDRFFKRFPPTPANRLPIGVDEYPAPLKRAAPPPRKKPKKPRKAPTRRRRYY